MTNDAGEARGYGGSELAKGKCSAGNLSPSHFSMAMAVSRGRRR